MNMNTLAGSGISPPQLIDLDDPIETIQLCIELDMSEDELRAAAAIVGRSSIALRLYIESDRSR
jgi:hypothetical protein